MMRHVQFLLAVAVLIATAPACGLLGPTCLARQKRGTVTSLSGEVAARAVTVHQVAYGSEGSQNDIDITWSGQWEAGGPRIRVYATKVECVQFVVTGGGPCASLDGASGFLDPATGNFVQTSLTVTNGRGNPDILGSPPEYKLWVVGDVDRATRYSITITWFYGPDC
jgi:hypothetical protein